MRTSEAAEGKVGGLPRYGGEVSTEAKENFQLVLGPLWDEEEKVISKELIRMEVEAVVVVVGTVRMFPLERWQKICSNRVHLFMGKTLFLPIMVT